MYNFHCSLYHLKSFLFSHECKLSLMCSASTSLPSPERITLFLLFFTSFPLSLIVIFSLRADTHYSTYTQVFSPLSLPTKGIKPLFTFSQLTLFISLFTLFFFLFFYCFSLFLFNFLNFSSVQSPWVL